METTQYGGLIDSGLCAHPEDIFNNPGDNYSLLKVVCTLCARQASEEGAWQGVPTTDAAPAPLSYGHKAVR